MSYMAKGFAIGLEVASGVFSFALAIFLIILALALLMTFIGYVGGAEDERFDDN